MTVKDLIEELSKYDESCDVTIAMSVFGYKGICNYFAIEEVRNDFTVNSNDIVIVCDDYS